jgi:hypothetical protein
MIGSRPAHEADAPTILDPKLRAVAGESNKPVAIDHSLTRVVTPFAGKHPTLLTIVDS